MSACFRRLVNSWNCFFKHLTTGSTESDFSPWTHKSYVTVLHFREHSWSSIKPYEWIELHKTLTDNKVVMKVCDSFVLLFPSFPPWRFSDTQKPIPKFINHRQVHFQFPMMSFLVCDNRPTDLCGGLSCKFNSWEDKLTLGRQKTCQCQDHYEYY